MCIWEFGKCMEKPNPKGNEPYILIGRTEAETEAPVLWLPDAKNWLLRKNPDAGKDWRREEKGMTEDETVGWHHRLDGHEFEQAPGVGDGQGSPACCSPWGRKKSDMTEQLNWVTEERAGLKNNRSFQEVNQGCSQTEEKNPNNTAFTFGAYAGPHVPLILESGPRYNSCETP